jgi:ligand-binding sensor domain-containing protein
VSVLSLLLKFVKKEQPMRRSIVALIILGFPVLLRAEAFRWTTFTATSNAVGLIEQTGHIWLATSGGLADVDLATGIFDIYTNTRGLAMNQCQAVGQDARGFIWAGLGDGRITRVHPVSGDVRQVEDLRGGSIFEITQILPVGDEVFVATNNGIYRFSYFSVVDNYRVRESIKFTGEVRVASIAVSDGYLYAGTTIGLWRASVSEPYLSQPSVWRNITTANSALPENNVHVVQVKSDGGILIATPSWICSLTDSVISREANIGGINHIPDGAFEGRVFAASYNQVFVRNPQTHIWSAFAPTLPDINGLLVAQEGTQTDLFACVPDGAGGAGGLTSIVLPSTDPAWSSLVRASGIGGNSISALSVDPQGRLWVGGAESTSGVYVYDGSAWRNFTRTTGYTDRFFTSDPRAFAFDDEGGAWIATQGGGVAWFTSLDTTFFNTWDSTGFSSQGARLAGIPEDFRFVVTRVARDSQGNIWISNRLSTVNAPLVRVPAAWIAIGNNRDPWENLAPGPPQVPNLQVEVEELAVDQQDRVWTGSSHDGLKSYVYDPYAVSNERWFSFQPSERQDRVTCFENINKQVLAWDVDQQGYLWVGTVNGAYYSQGGIPFELSQLHLICVADLPVGHSVNAVHVDAQDNKWFGTDEGVAVLDKNFVWIHVFQDATSVDHPSDLISNNVTAIASNPRTGEVWIGTQDGLSRFESPYVSSGAGLDKVWPYPQPFRADGSQHLRIDPARLGGSFDELRVYTISGRLVRKLSWSEMINPDASGGWDGRNNDHEFIAGGVYLLVATTVGGKSAVGKVAVLGR